MTEKPFVADHIARTHTFELKGRREELFHLFTPIGEKKWEEGWDPKIHYPRSGEAIAGGVFTTSQEGEQDTIWTIMEFDPRETRVKYARVTPGSRVAIVEVHCEDGSETTTRVRATYTFTALSEKGNDYLAVFTEPYYRDYIESWRTAIERHQQGESVSTRG